MSSSVDHSRCIALFPDRISPGEAYRAYEERVTPWPKRTASRSLGLYGRKRSCRHVYCADEPRERRPDPFRQTGRGRDARALLAEQKADHPAPASETPEWRNGPPATSLRSEAGFFGKRVESRSSKKRDRPASWGRGGV